MWNTFLTFDIPLSIQFYIPLGAIGVWRWGVWLFKKICALSYKPLLSTYSDSVSVITPVYNEDPNTFLEVLTTWHSAKPCEIIAVIDYSDNKCIAIFKDFSKNKINCRLIVTKIPGKREALALGIKEAKGEIVALVDSDTYWTENTLKNGVMPFINPKIGGVATRQNVLKPETLAQKLFDILLDLRYNDDFRFLTATGPYLRCISGRTAFYRKTAIINELDNLVNETFAGQKVISGDDKRLTYLIHSKGWHAYYQSTSQVYTPGSKTLKSFLSQKIRWTRNSWRSDIQAFRSKWVWSKPIFVIGFIDSAIQPFCTILSPLFFISSIILGFWIPAFVLLVWWHISRLIKIIPHLKRRPEDFKIISLYIIFTFVSSLIKIYALITLRYQGWITRWDSNRLATQNLVQKYFPQIAVLGLVTFLGWFIFWNRVKFVESFNLLTLPTTAFPMEPFQGKLLKDPANLEKWSSPAIVKHIVQPGDTINSVANVYQVESQAILLANFNVLPNWNVIEEGQVLTIPKKAINYTPDKLFNYERQNMPFLSISYDSSVNTILVEGRGKVVSIRQIAQSVGNYLKETEPGVWLLSANLIIGNGVTLNLEAPEVKWLKIESNEDGYVFLNAGNSRLNILNTKITSWNSKSESHDLKYQDGRAYIIVRGNSRLDISNSELAYLGFKDPDFVVGGTYGVSIRIPSRTYGKYLATGEVLNSKFHHNYFGAYTYGATGMMWEGNEFYENIQYGLDPHDDSSYFLVQNNIFRNNGNHGLIFSKRCNFNYIVNNVSFGNKLHGIMLHESSNDNLIMQNSVYANKDGIAIYDSRNNIVVSNFIENNTRGIRLNKNSTGNYFSSNTIQKSNQYGLYIYDLSDNNYFDQNRFNNNKVGSYIKTSSNNFVKNEFKNNYIGIYLAGTAQGNKFVSSDIAFNSKIGVYSKVPKESKNYLSKNTKTFNFSASRLSTSDL